MKSASRADASDSSYSGAMTDACKRRMPDFSDPGEGFEMVDPEALLEEKLALDRDCRDGRSNGSSIANGTPRITLPISSGKKRRVEHQHSVASRDNRCRME